LWLKIWDQILFSIAWLEKTLKVVNFREAVRNWTDPFFYFMLYKWDFEKYPKNYIISYKSSEKIDNLESTLSKEVWPHLTFITAREIIQMVIEIASKILVVVYFCLFYIFIFSFISFLVSIMFLRTFKDYKLSLLNILWWSKKALIKALNIEYIYLIFVWFLISIVFWSIILFVIFYFIKFFTFNVLIYSYWIWLIFIIFLFMSLSLVVGRKK
jgi:predicted lysophospholipase L1 biosynthesis ABC-type transport system permease subunit